MFQVLVKGHVKVQIREGACVFKELLSGSLWLKQEYKSGFK